MLCKLTLVLPADMLTLIDWLILATLKQLLSESITNWQCLDLVQRFVRVTLLLLSFYVQHFFSYTVFLPTSIYFLPRINKKCIVADYTLKINSVLLYWPGLPCVKRVFISVQLTQNINPVVLAVTSIVGYHCRATLGHCPAELREHHEMLPQIALQCWLSSSWQASA